MNAIQQTAVVDPSRRLLRLDEPLPATVSAGRVEIIVILRDKVPAVLSPEEERKREVARNHAAWKKFFAAIDAAPPLPGDDMPPRLNFKRDLPL
ncbi:MAG: hypothetical protein LBR23_07985 [Spirochaetaceae bacterium]|jgi:hypothetical protein|nr:hypothetical protein [Spirochaetaceae bacterium]